MKYREPLGEDFEFLLLTSSIFINLILFNKDKLLTPSIFINLTL